MIKMIRRCPQCGTTTDDMYGFCIRCGYEFSEVKYEENTCPLCGFSNPNEADYCVKCGTQLVFKNQNEQETDQNKPVVIKKEIILGGENIENRTSRWIIILGYIFSILGGIVGLIIAIYLSTRKDPIAKKHGRIQLLIFGIYILIIAILLLSGRFPYESYNQYAQLFTRNLTSFQL